ncbi:SDR family NAD(P)-dependent oxidoreductase [Terricaulis sp.]|uniref:SDR family NAD(P)-dependent oxidoreductase n=1 Tax=Terricaulis sp. TaxID=2768686 RepID=UPI002AC4A3B9|nr:SDR family oxidoreductase [Terricaulis sp.]MDZ4690581.1 SDR family oxidoreductase [Terricaulis sp.]
MAKSARFDFSGASVLVTGGSNGIGHAIATAFRDAGASVTITGTRADGVYESDFTGLAYRALNLRDAAGIAALAAALPKLDVLVNCAGQARFEEYDPDVFEETVAVNLTGSFRMASAVLPQLKASRGSVINIASMTSYFGMSLIPGYGASKAGVLQMTKTLAEAWASDGVRVNAIAPGWVETNMTAPAQSNPEFDAKIVAHTPLKRWAKPAEMAGTVLFLCSDAAAFITGVTVPVDGGFSAVM